MSFSKAIDPDHDISDHYYYDNYTKCSYYCSNYCSTPITITIATIYIKQYNMQPHMGNTCKNQNPLCNKNTFTGSKYSKLI